MNFISVHTVGEYHYDCDDYFTLTSWMTVVRLLFYELLFHIHKVVALF